jgi:hypothetical protein
MTPQEDDQINLDALKERLVLMQKSGSIEWLLKLKRDGEKREAEK